jgi:hypothetical protein
MEQICYFTFSTKAPSKISREGPEDFIAATGKHESLCMKKRLPLQQQIYRFISRTVHMRVMFRVREKRILYENRKKKR